MAQSCPTALLRLRVDVMLAAGFLPHIEHPEPNLGVPPPKALLDHVNWGEICFARHVIAPNLVFHQSVPYQTSEISSSTVRGCTC